eukprot:11267541-Alexandrium_andersonii.AAC.1
MRIGRRVRVDVAKCSAITMKSFGKLVDAEEFRKENGYSPERLGIELTTMGPDQFGELKTG